MNEAPRQVLLAIDRWEERGLVTTELADRLREETVESAVAGTARLTQYLVASVAALVLLIAGGVFLDWAWPLMGRTARSGVLGGARLVVYQGGARIEWMRKWLPAALLMQTSGLGLMLAALVYASNVWEPQTTGGVVVGVLALALPIVLAPRSFRRSAVMPAVHLCFTLAFMAVFLDRVVHLDADGIVWVLDGLLAVASLSLVGLLRSDPGGERHPWALNAFVAAIYSGFVMIWFTGVGPLSLDDATVYPLDAWLFLVVALSLWGLHRAPTELRRDWFDAQLAYTLVAWIPLGLFTGVEAMRGPPEVGLALVGGAAVAGFAYAVRQRTRRVLSTSALAFVVAVWYWGVERGGALGAVFALLVTAAVLFRLSGRIQSWVGGRQSSA